MAIARGAGTEIIRSANFMYIEADTTSTYIIGGQQHHIYTVLSVICYAVNTCINLTVDVFGYDSNFGSSGQGLIIFKTGALTAGETYVWNDKFSFMGSEPTDFGSNGIDDTDGTKQDLIADQATTTTQRLRMTKGDSGDDWHVVVTFIDQNNA